MGEPDSLQLHRNSTAQCNKRTSIAKQVLFAGSYPYGAIVNIGHNLIVLFTNLNFLHFICACNLELEQIYILGCELLPDACEQILKLS